MLVLTHHLPPSWSAWVTTVCARYSAEVRFKALIWLVGLGYGEEVLHWKNKLESDIIIARFFFFIFFYTSSAHTDKEGEYKGGCHLAKSICAHYTVRSGTIGPKFSGCTYYAHFHFHIRVRSQSNKCKKFLSVVELEKHSLCCHHRGNRFSLQKHVWA